MQPQIVDSRSHQLTDTHKPGLNAGKIKESNRCYLRGYIHYQYSINIIFPQFKNITRGLGLLTLFSDVKWNHSSSSKQNAP